MSNYMLYGNELYHHGVKGQKWGIRRYQNEDGSYTEKGLRRISDNRYGSNRFRKYDGSASRQAKLGSAGSYKRALNNVDQGIVEERYYAEKSKQRLENLQNKYNKISAKKDAKSAKNPGANTVGLDKKMYKTDQKIKSAKQEMKQHQANVKHGEEITNRLLSGVSKSGYSVSKTKVSRLKNSKEVSNAVVIGHSVLGIWGSVPLAMITAKSDPDGTRYKVKKNK